jgi:tetratricopeptide (TPR) repeat protein
MGAKKARWVRGLLAGVVLLHGCGSKPPEKPADMKSAAEKCMRSRDFACAEMNWQAYVAARPTDATAVANLGIVQNLRDEHEQAIVQFQKAIDLGEGTYDLFAYYADSLGKLGRTEQAIDWSYKSLAVVPNLVDVRGSLAKLLVQQRRRYEALSLLAAFDDHLAGLGQGAYFEGQRIAIESALKDDPAATAEQRRLRLAKIDQQFFAPVTLGAAPVGAFLVDTGATYTTIDDELLQRSKLDYRPVRQRVEMQTADGRRVQARLVSVATMRLGAFQLHDVTLAVCGHCARLLGQADLSRFDMSSSRVQGVEFLALSPRGEAGDAAPKGARIGTN